MTSRFGCFPWRGKGTGYRAAHDFAILDLGEGLRPLVQVDTAWGAVATSDKPREYERFTRRWDEMSSHALTPEETPDFVYHLAQRLKSH
ncbi:Scr1 family TA system antitoxin-like transcriptional regulator [Streptomyces sp. NPDC058665]|uniref:Scr1 family TA system antitoxin-like transcriptional regulator n=1 Tax=Streptomyces sp. NPDC058665 TaxID=3346586 RepID=UPI0036478F43